MKYTPQPINVASPWTESLQVAVVERNLLLKIDYLLNDIRMVDHSRELPLCDKRRISFIS